MALFLIVNIKVKKKKLASAKTSHFIIKIKATDVRG
jgi:hypothetical protein